MKLLTKVMAVILIIPFVMAGCTKKEEKGEPSKSSERSVIKKETVVKVPEQIKGKWKAVTVAVKEKGTGKVQTYSVEIGSDLKLPGTDFSVRVINFFPHFVMEGINLTSKSNETRNPAMEIRIYRGDREIYHGWIFANYPTTNMPKEFAFDLGLIGATPADRG